MFYEMLRVGSKGSHTGKVDIRSFVTGCIRLKGDRGLHTLAFEVKLLHQSFCDLLAQVNRGGGGCESRDSLSDGKLGGANKLLATPAIMEEKATGSENFRLVVDELEDLFKLSERSADTC